MAHTSWSYLNLLFFSKHLFLQIINLLIVKLLKQYMNNNDTVHSTDYNKMQIRVPGAGLIRSTKNSLFASYPVFWQQLTNSSFYWNSVWLDVLVATFNHSLALFILPNNRLSDLNQYLHDLKNADHNLCIFPVVNFYAVWKFCLVSLYI